MKKILIYYLMYVQCPVHVNNDIQWSNNGFWKIVNIINKRFVDNGQIKVFFISALQQTKQYFAMFVVIKVYKIRFMCILKYK